MIQTTELWADVPGWEGYYQVSTHGNVKSLERVTIIRYNNRGLTLRHIPERILKPTLHLGARLVVNLFRRGKHWWGAVHHLVLNAFVGPRPPGLMGCHNDGDVTNNHVNNLRWDTAQSNMDDKVRHGHCPMGITHYRAKWTVEQVRQMRKEYEVDGMSIAEIARQYHADPGCIRPIVQYLTWRNVI